MGRGWKGVAYSPVACPKHFAVDHESFYRRSNASTPTIETLPAFGRLLLSPVCMYAIIVSCPSDPLPVSVLVD